MKQQAHHVVIVGGGAGGLELAARLGRRFGPKHIVLIDTVDSHVWKPSLHEVAAGTLDTHREGMSYFLLARQCGFTFVHGSMNGVDRDAMRVMLAPVHSPTGEEIFPSRSVTYDTLVLAIGSKSNFFGTPGAAEYAIALDSTAQAEHFRKLLLRELAMLNGRRALTKITTGASILAHSDTPHGVTADVQNQLSKPDDVLHIAIVGGGATGVELAAGIEAPAILSELGLETNRHHQIVVDGRLQSSNPQIFAFGDCAEAPWEGQNRPLPAKAQVASQQAAFLYDTLRTRIKGQPEKGKTFRFRDYGSLVSVGHSEGVGSLMGVLSGKNWFVEGLLARLMYMSLHLRHHMAVLGVWQTAALALGRLLLRRGTPRVKLH